MFPANVKKKKIRETKGAVGFQKNEGNIWRKRRLFLLCLICSVCLVKESDRRCHQKRKPKTNMEKLGRARKLC